MLPTPDISHLTSKDYEHIYEPAEDSFLFLDALEKDRDYILSLRPTICFEIGSGSGIVSTFLAKILGKESAFYFCSDINPTAASVTHLTGLQNNVDLNPVISDLVSPCASRLRGQIDILLFNPPYVVTPSEEVGSHGIEASWAGGLNGREVIDRLLPMIPDLLSASGTFYMVVIKQNKPEEIQKIMSEKGFQMTNVLSRKSGPENLSVLKFVRSH